MLNTVFELDSLTASLEGATDLRWSAFAGKDRHPGLVAESEAEYREFLKWTQADRLEAYSIDHAVRDRLDDAARTYRNLCAHWTSRGQFHDAGRAYVHSRRLERQELLTLDSIVTDKFVRHSHQMTGITEISSDFRMRIEVVSQVLS